MKFAGLLAVTVLGLAVGSEGLPIRTLASTTSETFVDYPSLASWFREKETGADGVVKIVNAEWSTLFATYHPAYWGINTEAWARMGVSFGVVDPSLLSNKLHVSNITSFITDTVPVVAANLDVDSYFFAYFINRYHIVKTGGVTIGYIPIWGDNNKVATVNFDIAVPPIATRLRTDEKVDVVIGICLFSQSFFTDRVLEMSDFSKYQMDALLLPDGNTDYTSDVLVNGTWMLPKRLPNTNTRSKYFTQIDMEKVGGAWTFETSLVDYTVPFNNSQYMADAAWYKQQQDLYEANNKRVGSIDKDLVHTQYRCMEGECEAGNLITAALVEKFPSTDLVILNGGGIFSAIDYDLGLPAGWKAPRDITLQDVTDLFPFSNTICQYKANATGIWTLFEHGLGFVTSTGEVDTAQSKKGAYPQTSSNVQVDYDASRPEGSRVTSIRFLNKATGVWEDITRRKHYTVTSTSYLCDDAGDGYPPAWIEGTLQKFPENVHTQTTDHLQVHDPYTPVNEKRLKLLPATPTASLASLNLIRLFPADCSDTQRYLLEWEDCEECPAGQHHPVPGTDPCVNLPGSDSVNLGIVIGIPVGVLVLGALVTYWLLTSKQRKIKNLFNTNKIAEDCATAVAGMKLEELDYLFTLEKPTSIQTSFITIIKTLKSYRDYMPQSVLESHDTDKDCETETASSILFHANGGVARVRHDGDSSSVATSNTHKSEKQFLLMTGLKKKHVTVLVVNVVGFRKVLQAKSYTEVETIHSSYIKKVLSIIGDKGVAEPFCGDRVVVSWNSSKNWAAHKEAGCKAGLALTRAAAKFENSLEVCVGISSSSVLAGNIGVDGMRKFSLLGPCYNEAFVLMMLNQKYKTTVLVGASIASSFTEKWFLLFQDRLFNGKSQLPLELWELIGEKQQDEQEWMYSLASSESRDPHRDLNEAWRFFLRDEVANARAQLNKVELKGHSHDLLRNLVDTAHERTQGDEYYGIHPLLLDHF